MLLNYLGIDQNLTTLGFVWYYFNVLAITGIVYMVLKLAIVRAQNSISNKAENISKADNNYLYFVMFISTFAIIYFLLREYIKDLKDLWQFIFDKLPDLRIFNG